MNLIEENHPLGDARGGAIEPAAGDLYLRDHYLASEPDFQPTIGVKCDR